MNDFQAEQDKALRIKRNPSAPQPGDITACIRCGAVMQFADDLTVRGFTEEEAKALIEDRDAMDALSKVVRGIEIMRRAQ